MIPNNKLENSTKKQHLTALIITYNEERNINEAIADLDFADEIIIVDSYSTDRTVALIAAHEKVKMVQHPFENFAAQRNFAISLASHPWILFLDADERIPALLKTEIKNTLEQKNSHVAYYFYRTFIFKNTKLRFSGWQTDKITRLFKKEAVQYNPQKIVHEKLIVNGTIGKLKNKLIHYSYFNYTEYTQKMIQYGKLKAQEELKKGTKPNFFHYYIRPSFHFLYRYFVRLGILDGKKGVIICYLNAMSVSVRFRELKKLKTQF
jgi:glycosyltransferase involved in cell wall biosynthesis